MQPSACHLAILSSHHLLMTTEPQDRLRSTIRLLGNLLGETIIEQEGQEIFDLEEEIRALSKAWRAGDLSVAVSYTHLFNE